MGTNQAGLVGVVAVALVATLTLAASGGSDPASEECTVAVAAAIPIQTDTVIVKATHSEAIDGEPTAFFPVESGIEVVSATPVEAEPLTVNLTLRTAEAQAGDWDLTLAGANGGECKGKVKVQAGSDVPN